MNKNKQTSFKEEIRRSLVVHALAPCILSIVVLVLAFTVIGMGIITAKNKKSCREFSDFFSQVSEAYLKEADSIGESIDLGEFQNSVSYRVDIVSEIYEFLNTQSLRGDYYLFDQNGDVVFSTGQDPIIIQYIQNRLSMICRDEDKTELRFMYDSYNLNRTSSPLYIAFRKISDENGQWGYGGFVISAGSFNDYLGNQELSIVITNGFYRIFSENGLAFENDRGKLEEKLRDGSGLIWQKGRCYYISSTQLKEKTEIIAFSDCTAFMQLIIISFAIVIVLSVTMVITIQISAKTISRDKTEMIGQLAQALGQVEKGDLDVTLDIQGNDEFEVISKSFNMMLGSLRHLISRHQQLAQENMTATVQAMESQFNPHFLFNTLESIRYMIKFEPKAAEKMIVSLARLLRYSIQHERDTVELREELEFVDRYLQIMLYRYGDRLKYKICIEQQDQQVTVPKMILQPLVENSIKYGFQEDNGLEIIIEGELLKDRLEIRIKDNGCGIEEGLLNSLRENLKSRLNRSEHIGLYNVHRRILLVYGVDWGIRLESRQGEGTTVFLTIPVNNNDPDEEFMIIRGE